MDFDTFCKSDFRVVKVKDCQPVKKSNKLLCFTLDDGTGTDRQILSGIAAYYKPEELIGKSLVAIVNLPPRKMMGRESCGMLLSAVHTEHGGGEAPADHGGRRHPRRGQALLSFASPHAPRLRTPFDPIYKRGCCSICSSPLLSSCASALYHP